MVYGIHVKLYCICRYCTQRQKRSFFQVLVTVTLSMCITQISTCSVDLKTCPLPPIESLSHIAYGRGFRLRCSHANKRALTQLSSLPRVYMIRADSPAFLRAGGMVPDTPCRHDQKPGIDASLRE